MIEKTILQNDYVRLEPLDPQHREGLFAASAPEIWQHMPLRVARLEDIDQFIAEAVQAYANGEGVGFAVMDRVTEAVVGSTGFYNYVPQNKRIEIGFTWYTPNSQRSPVNTSCKFLLLQHAFEILDVNRVEFKTDSLNLRSRRALARLGATEEGTLRAHVVQPDGRLRHSVYYSILKTEWPAIRGRLSEFLAR
jgi:RimJ/RimL family protein N-acetyltransferase